jgi:hypothetical protein
MDPDLDRRERPAARGFLLRPRPGALVKTKKPPKTRGSSDHVVSGPATDAEIQASDNKVIKDYYNKSRLPDDGVAKISNNE